MDGKDKNGYNLRRFLWILGGMTALLATVILVKGTYAWYVRNNQLQGKNAEIGVDYDDLRMDCVAYQYDIKQDRVISTEESDSDSFDMEHLEFQSYDMIFRQKNRYIPMVIVIKLSGLVLQEKSTVDLIIHRDTASENNPVSSGTLSSHVSSIMRFTLIGGGDSSNPFAINDIWQNTVTDFAGEQSGTKDGIGYDSKTMTILRRENNATLYEKADAITLSLSYTQSQLEAGELFVYLYVTYDKTLTTSYERQQGLNTGGTIEGIGEVFRLNNDLIDISARVR